MVKKVRLTRGAYAEPGTTLQNKTGDWRILRPIHRPRPAPCHFHCPAESNPQAWIANFDEGDLEKAFALLTETNPFPAITGRVCPHPCETGCNRASFDQAVCIHGLERYLGDLALEKGWRFKLPEIAENAARVAVVGAGPAGLASAYHLRRFGFRVTVYEHMPDAGGMLRMALPAYRLPRRILDEECRRVLDAGIEAKFHVRIGKDVSLQELRKDFDAVFLGIGADKPKDWNVGGVRPVDLHEGLDLLYEWNAHGALPPMRSAAVIGGGNTALDVARVLLRSGVPEVHLITHRSPPQEGLPEHLRMSANPSEIAQALEEGVRLHPFHGVTRLILRDGKVIGLEMVRMKRLLDEQGRTHRVPFEGTETILHVDQVIPAVGQVVDGAGLETLLAGRNFIQVDERFASGLAGVYSGGDATGRAGTVAAAIGNGLAAARTIAADLLGMRVECGCQPPVSYAELNTAYFSHKTRRCGNILPVAARKADSEVEQTMSAADATAEVSRCFSCGQCMACDNCWTFCPDQAVLKSPYPLKDGSFYTIDYDYCKGCGICAKECPCAFILMEEE